MQTGKQPIFSAASKHANRHEPTDISDAIARARNTAHMQPTSELTEFGDNDPKISAIFMRSVVNLRRENVAGYSVP